jgi:ATP-dependent Zn protease
MTTVEAGTAQNIEYVPEETRAVAIHEAGHAAAGHVYMGDEILSTRLSIRKRGGSLGHHQSMEKEERFSHFRGYFMGRLIAILGAMAAEHVFYGENSAGVTGDVYTATATAASMVGVWAMGADPVTFDGRPELDGVAKDSALRLQHLGNTIMNRASGGSPFTENPLGAVLGDHEKRTAAAQLLGQAYVIAYTLMMANRAAIEQIAETLVDRKELYGDEVVDLLDSVDLRRPEIDLGDHTTWPTVA